MINLVNNLLDYVRMNDDDYDYDEYDEEDAEELRSESVVTQNVPSEKVERHSRKRSNTESYETPKRDCPSRVESRSKVVPMRTASQGFEVCIMKPRSFDEATQICEILLEGRACVVNLEGLDTDEAQRIMDFVSGCIFAIEGKLHRIAKYIFIFAPEHIDLSGDNLDMIANEKRSNTVTINKEF